MTAELAGQTITDVLLIGSSQEYSGVRLAGCTLKRCRLVQVDDPGFGLVVRDVVLERCRIEGCAAGGVYFEDVTVDTLRLSRPHLLSGCVFKHVTLRGKIGSLMAIPPNPMSPHRPGLTAGAVEKYKDVDWALDISEAVFSDADFFYVPGDLIRRDENTQVLLRREAFRDIDWRGLPGSAGIWVRRFESTPFDSIVGIAPKGSKEFAKAMADIEWLYSRGLAG
jgi:uncharacterized protein YjbI with pentapeptide repeats